MAIDIALSLDGEDYLCNLARPEHRVVREDDDIGVRVVLSGADQMLEPLAYVEDYELSLSRVSSIDDSESTVFAAPSSKLFREAFGSAVIRILVGAQEFSLFFEVLAKKIHAAQAEAMIRYLTFKSEHIIRVCLSRTTRSVGTCGEGGADPEMILSAVESFVDSVLNVRLDLQHRLRKRLIPVKRPAWMASRGEAGIDPYDVLSNLDALEPTVGASDVVLHGRSYAAAGIEVVSLESTLDVEENAVLLGGIFSMRRVLLSLRAELTGNFKKGGIDSHDKEYVSLHELLLQLSAGGMVHRCECLIETLEELIRYFERNLKVVFRGELVPKVSPFVRSSRLYRTLYEQLQRWYELGSPSLEGRIFLIKLRSLSKIFEYFSLFKLFDYFVERDWVLSDVRTNQQFDALIPVSLSFQRNGVSITIEHEPKIFPLNSDSAHFDLVDVKHSNASGISWWPDFTLRLSSNNIVHYFILDAKYSTSRVVRERHLPHLYDKYFSDMAVYDARRNVLDHGAILGVLAIFPWQNHAKTLTSWRWAPYSLTSNRAIRLPIIAGMPLSPDSNDVFVFALDKMLKISENQSLALR